MNCRAFLRTSTAFALSATVLLARGSDPKADPSVALVQRVLKLTNEERLKAGLLPLVMAPGLAESAKWKAQDMASRNYFDHSDGPHHDYVDRASEFGYDNWRYLGENLAAGQPTAEEVVAEWMASPGHRANILRPDYREIGIAFSTDSHSEFRVYWAQEFGAR
jgi:uncharacterized protein YkwD